MKTKLEKFTKMTVQVRPHLFHWLYPFKIVEYLEDDLIPVQKWITFTQIELYNYMNLGYWDDEFEQTDWGSIEKDVAKQFITALYNLPIPDNVTYVKLEMEN